MSPLYITKCKFCQEESEVWRHSYSEIERELLRWACPKCGYTGYEKVPARTSWHFGDALKEKN